KTVAQLEGQCRIAILAFAHGLHIRLYGAERLDALFESGQASAKDNSTQAELLTEFLARSVETPTDAQPAKLGIDADVHSIQPLAIRIMSRSEAAAADFGPAMRCHRGRFVDSESCAESDQFAFVLGYELAGCELCL